MVSSPNVLWAPKYHPGFALSPPDHHRRHHRLVVVYTCSTIDTGQLLRLNIAVIVTSLVQSECIRSEKMKDDVDNIGAHPRSPLSYMVSRQVETF